MEIDKSSHDKDFISKAVGVLTRAFYDYPEYVQLLPNPEKRKQKLPIMFEVFTKYCLNDGIVLVTSSNGPLEGVLMYIPPPAEIGGGDIIRAGALKIPFKIGLGFIQGELRIMKAVSNARKTHATIPHAYLFLLAVDQPYQKQGFAAALMDHMLNALDKENLGCYLETTAPENVDYYRRYNFDLVETKNVPGTSLTIHMMMRQPSVKRLN
ncbi:MAG TPA: GNAT family N-acetyltransferase [Candidatus Lokiarchaeia archaeon]|nr:GNAT family N-acetyltransferase [Candidatus Lokiarchaeia archaeon]